jgi:archaellin
MKKGHTVILLILLAFVATVFADVAINLTVQSQGQNATLSWTVSGPQPSGQAGFFVIRSAPGTSAVTLNNSPIAYSSNITSYQYTDNVAYKTTSVLYTYQVELVDVNNFNTVYGSSKQVNAVLNISGVQQTWGSIKAMFR